MKYTCHTCKGEFDSEWTDEEAKVEAKEVFGNDVFEREPTHLVCDDCYKQIIPWAKEQGLL